MSRRVIATGAVVAVGLVGLVWLSTGCTAWKRFAYSGPGRDGWQQPARVVESLGLAPGDRVADLGAGGGYFVPYLSDAVGPEGTVYAVDVDEPLLEDLGERNRAEGRSNVEIILARYDDPLLPEGGVDLLFTSNTYHHLQDRTAYFGVVRAGLRPDARVAIVELNGKGWFSGLFGHHTDPALIRTEMEAAGYRVVDEHDWLERQSFLIFAPRP